MQTAQMVRDSISSFQLMTDVALAAAAYRAAATANHEANEALSLAKYKARDAEEAEAKAGYQLRKAIRDLIGPVPGNISSTFS